MWRQPLDHHAARNCSFAHTWCRIGLDTDGHHVCAGFADDGLWGKLSALGIIMIIISTLLVLLAQYLGNRFKMQQKT
jgi:hypothetical protein